MFINSVILNKNNLEENLIGLFYDVDEDLNGNNGKEYITNEEGFESDLEYFANKYKNENIETAVTRMANDVFRYSNSFTDYATNIAPLTSTDFLVSVAFS